MTYFLYGLFFLSCIVLVITVLLQPGKTDAGALFTSNISSNAFGSRGTATVLSKTTIIAATIFMLSALMLSMPALTGNVSVLSTNPETPAESAPVANTNANVDTNQPGVNTNNAVQVPPITNLNSVAPANNATNAANTATNTAANKAANTTKANTEKKADTKKETNTKK
jgi:preprotein translocase subunit SecG